MPVVLLNLDRGTYGRIRKLVGKGDFESVEAFLSLATRNQLMLEEASGERAGRLEFGAAARAPQPAGWAHCAVEEHLLVEGSPTQDLLWGQIYRLLPMKLVVRVLARRIASDSLVLDDVADSISTAALQLGDWLSDQQEPKRDRSTPSLAVAWPNRKRHEEASRARFVAQYVGRIDKSGVLHGLGRDLGFLGLREDGCTIALTKSAVAFSEMENPVIDGFSPSVAFSDEERLFLATHIAQDLPAEAAHMRHVLEILGKNGGRPSWLDEKLRPFYEAHSAASSSKEVSLMRSGVIGRMGELGLVATERTGTKAVYHCAADQQGITSILDPPAE